MHFLLIDGHALIYRAYHAFPPLTDPSGRLVNAVYGFTRHVLTAIREYEPEYLAVTFDHHGPTFRHAKFDKYKANRVAMPDDLIPQIDIIKDVVKTLNFPQFELEGYEADDLIGTLSKQIEAVNDQTRGEDINTIIVTGDRDSFQLVSEQTHVWLPGRGKGTVDTEYDRDGVKSRMGVYPEQIVDLKALMGDASDNIPGVAGIGEKTACKLIVEFGSLAKVYETVDSGQVGAVMTARIREKLVTDKENALLSQKLAQIDRVVPISLDLPACKVSSYDKQTARELMESLEFKSLVSLLPPDDFELNVQSALF